MIQTSIKKDIITNCDKCEKIILKIYVINLVNEIKKKLVVNELNSMLNASHDTNIDKINDINTNRYKGKKSPCFFN